MIDRKRKLDRGRAWTGVKVRSTNMAETGKKAWSHASCPCEYESRI